jgi:hypothetical protein
MIEEPLLCYFFEICKHGITINMLVIALRALYLSPKFCKKRFTAWCSAVVQFVLAHLITYQMGMHTMQRPPAKVESKALNYMQLMHHIVLGNNYDLHFVLNMHQMPVYFF